MRILKQANNLPCLYSIYLDQNHCNLTRYFNVWPVAVATQGSTDKFESKNSIYAPYSLSLLLVSAAYTTHDQPDGWTQSPDPHSVQLLSNWNLKPSQSCCNIKGERINILVFNGFSSVIRLHNSHTTRENI